MSIFLKPEAFPIPAGALQSTIQTTIDGKLIAQGWQRITFDTVNFISDFIPPATETTGDGVWRQVARIYYNSADISYSMYDYPIANACAQMHRIYEKTAGAVAAAAIVSTGTPFAITASGSGSTLTVTATAGVIGVGSPIYLGGIYRGYVSALGTGTGGNGTYTVTGIGTIASTSGTAEAVVTVTGAAGSAGSTAKDNLYALWVALMASSDPAVTAWQITYFPGQGGVDSILCERKTVNANLASIIGNANVNFTAQGDPVLAGAPTVYGVSAALLAKFSLTIDRSNSFYVYMSIFSRSFTIGIKTTTSVYGWGFCYWSPNADAMAALPPKPMWAINPLCHISEGFYGLVNGTALAPTNSYSVRTSNIMALCAGWSYVPSNTMVLNAISTCNPFGGGTFPGVLFSVSPQGIYSNDTETFTAYGDGFPPVNTSAPSGSADILSVALYPISTTFGGNIIATAPHLSGQLAGAFFEDVFSAHNRNLDGNEVVCVAGLQSPANITLAQNLDDTTAYTTILLNTVTGLASTGTNYVVLNQEVFSYTGVSGGNTLTGVTRAYNGSPQRRHYIGDQVQQGGWFIKLNGGFAYMGLLRPTAS